MHTSIGVVDFRVVVEMLLQSFIFVCICERYLGICNCFLSSEHLCLTVTEEVGAENDTCGLAWAWLDPAEGCEELGWVGSMGRRVLKNSLIRVFDIHFQ